MFDREDVMSMWARLVPSLIVAGALGATAIVLAYYGPAAAMVAGVVLAFEAAAVTALIRLAGGSPRH